MAEWNLMKWTNLEQSEHVDCKITKAVWIPMMNILVFDVNYWFIDGMFLLLW